MLVLHLIFESYVQEEADNYSRYFYLTGTALKGFKLALYLPWL
jgi:hypothetical protein